MSTTAPLRRELALTFTYVVLGARRTGSPRMNLVATASARAPIRSAPNPLARRSVAPVTLSSSSPWWRPDIHAARRPFLEARGRIRHAVRWWFEQRAFVEVETAALQVSPGNEAHLHAFKSRIEGPDGADALLFLRTSPEFACKSLLAAGERRVFELGKVWRNRERGPLHHPEFTLLEWYRAEETYEALMIDCAQLLALAAEAAGTKTLT